MYSSSSFFVRKMKFLALIFLFGLATASFHDILDDSDEQDFLLRAEQKKGKDDLQTELARKLRETLDRILKEIKEAVEDGKGVSQKLLDEARDLVHKLKEYGVNISDEAKDVINYLKTRVERWAEELLNILRKKDSSVQRTESKPAEMGRKLREAILHVLDKIKKDIEEGKEISQKLLDQAKDLIIRLKEYGVDVGNEIKDMLEYMKTRISKWAKELLDALRGKRDLLDRFKNLIEDLKLREPLEKLRELIGGKADLSKIREFIEERFSKSKFLMRHFLDKLEEGKDRLKSFLDRLFHKNEARSITERMKDMIESLKLREKFEKLRDMITEGVEKIKIKEFITEIIPEKFRLIRDFFVDALDKGRENLKNMIDKIMPKM